jgi:hypothetical protein
VYRTVANVQVLAAEDELSGEDVVPGFCCRLADILD